MRPTVTALLFFLAAGPAWAQSPRNPYLLELDRSAYTLSISRSGAYATAAGGSSAAPQALPPLVAPQIQRASEAAELVLREREYERRIAELVRERDGWKLHAQRLESELLLGRGAMTAPLRLPPAPAN